MERIKDLNRIKVVLTEKHLTGKWLAEQLGKKLIEYEQMDMIAEKEGVVA